MKYKISVLKNKRGCWFWNLKAGNGHILAHSEEYSRKAKALQAAVKFAAIAGCRLVSD